MVKKTKQAFRSVLMSRNARFIAGAVIAIAFLGWMSGFSGAVHGIEFSPDRFSHRSFHYYQWCGIRISPKRTHEWHSHIDHYIHKNGFAEIPDEGAPRWHFVKGFAPGVRGWHGEAKYMCQSVGCWSDDDKWVQWSYENPQLARIVWPQVVTWARNEQYGAIGSLFLLIEPGATTSPADIHQLIKLAELL